MNKFIIVLLSFFSFGVWADQLKPLTEQEWSELTSIMYSIEAESASEAWRQYRSIFNSVSPLLLNDFKNEDENKELIDKFSDWLAKELRPFTPSMLTEEKAIALPDEIKEEGIISEFSRNTFVRLPFCENMLCFTVRAYIEDRNGELMPSPEYLVTANRDKVIDAVVISTKRICNEVTCSTVGVGETLIVNEEKSPLSKLDRDQLVFPVGLGRGWSPAQYYEIAQRYYVVQPTGEIKLLAEPQWCEGYYPSAYLKNGGPVLAEFCREFLVPID